MSNTLSAWIQMPDYSVHDVGFVERDEMERLWGDRWAQKCIRDAAEEVASRRFSPYKKDIPEYFCAPQLGFDRDNATLAVSPAADVKRAILYGAPLQEFKNWTVFLDVNTGRKLLGWAPRHYAFEITVSANEALDLVRLFYDTQPMELVPAARNWRKQVEVPNPFRFITALFL